MSRVRGASHAGTWYSHDASTLRDQLSAWLGQAASSDHAPARAIISPHAGYSQIDPSRISRVIVLGPSHHYYLKGCALTNCDAYETPLGDIQIDVEAVSQLWQTEKFDRMTLAVDEAEHSIEMQLPFLSHVMQGHPFRLVPILVGSLDSKSEKAYGEIIGKYLLDTSNLVIISSDFCHWGQHFGFQYHNTQCTHFYQSIEMLDRQGMHLIEEGRADEFQKYIKDQGNTICGRNPIAILLRAMGKVPSYRMRFLHYSQSGKPMKKTDSSVSYAAASLVVS